MRWLFYGNNKWIQRQVDMESKYKRRCVYGEVKSMCELFHLLLLILKHAWFSFCGLWKGLVPPIIPIFCHPKNRSITFSFTAITIGVFGLNSLIGGAFLNAVQGVCRHCFGNGSALFRGFRRKVVWSMVFFLHILVFMDP